MLFEIRCEQSSVSEALRKWRQQCLKSVGQREEPGLSFDIHQGVQAWKESGDNEEGGGEDRGKQVCCEGGGRGGGETNMEKQTRKEMKQKGARRHEGKADAR